MTSLGPRLRRAQAAIVSAALSLALAAGLALSPDGLRNARERALDVMIRLSPAPAPTSPAVVIVDIGAADEAGRPWNRVASGRLAAALAAAAPAAMAWDIVFAGDCAAGTGKDLAAGLAAAPAVLGMLLSALPTPAPRPLPVFGTAEGAGAGLWSAPGLEAPCPAFTADGATLGSISLPGDSTARVRMVPAAVAAAGEIWPALPVELLRRGGAAPLPVLDAAPALHLGRAIFPLDPGAMLRFRPSSREERLARTVPAEAVLQGLVAQDRFRDALVLVGSSLPQRGGLRPTAADPLYPSVQIAADVAVGLLADRLPWRPAGAAWVEASSLALAGLVLALALMHLPPLATAGLALVAGGLWAAGAVAIHLLTGRLYDPLFPALGLVMPVLAGLILRAAAHARAERALRRRMGQLLPGAVVARLADDPHLLRLAGERREITALFTDIEGFSAMANRLPPEILIATLDRYFATVTTIVLRHGGMVDKIVGDGLHALFNAPLDQPGHVDAALAAAGEIVRETEVLRPVLGLGRTRIGVETGPVILGDVGGGARIDYTAHGPAVNLAARLQEMGKTLGPAVIVGPAAATRATLPLRPLQTIEIRSFGPLPLFTLG
ncbi:MAG: adenylate/guanylate cyclase domain-containing protein [Rhodobacteraceae bacterium]|jgi:adenylate cyclase|nr:adenylate/guanylate cyclase domain-containing protein [Paracoccaceae bacterium]